MSMNSASDASAPTTIKLDKIINGFGIIKKISLVLNYGGLAILFAMIVCTFVDVFMRYVVNNAVVGMKEYTQVMLFILVGMCVAHTFSKGKHITVTLVTDIMKPKMRSMFAIMTSIITAVFLGFLVYSSFTLLKLYVVNNTKLGAIMQITMWPMIIIVTAGFALSFLIAVSNIMTAIKSAIINCVSAKGYVLSIAVTIVLLVFAVLLATQTVKLSTGILCILGILFMFLLMFSGVPVGYTLWIVGTIIIANVRGFTSGMAQLATLNYQTTTDYTWSVVAFFLLMGFLCFHAKFGEDIFRCINTFLSRVSGGICVVTIGASACLAAVVGDNNAVVSTMTSIAYPEMKRMKYDNKLCMGTLAAGSCLGPLIPPSTGFITFSLLTSVSLGKLFASGIIPGIILALAFIVTILIICKRDPSKGPKGEKFTTMEKIRSLPGALPIIILFIFVIGGTMIGAFTATEAGAMGCVGALIIGLIMRRFNFKTILEAFDSSGSMIGMIFTVIVGAKVFSSGLGWCNLSSIISNFFERMNWGPMVTVAIILIIFFICGFFIDLIPLMFVGIPIVYGIIASMGVDGVWFGCLLVMICNVGVITPPFATVLFVMKGMLPEVPIKDIFKGVVPFVIATIVVVVILFCVPDLVLWLPNRV